MTAPPNTREILALAADATSRTVRNPALLGLLLLTHFLVAGLAWLWTAQVLGTELRGRPAPDLFTWVAMINQEPRLLFELLTAGGSTLALYLVTGALVAVVILCRFAEVSVGRALRRPFLRLLLLRGMIIVAAAAMLAGLWFTVAPLSSRFHELDNELLILALHLLIALPFMIPLLVVLCVAHYAQVMLIRLDMGVFGALGRGLKLVHARPLAAGGLWVAGWGAWILVAVVFTLPGLESLVLAQVGVLVRVAIHLWMYAAGWEVSALGLEPLSLGQREGARPSPT